MIIQQQLLLLPKKLPHIVRFSDRLGISQSYISRLEKRIILRLRREILRMS